MRTMTKERKKEGPRLGRKGRADAKASRQLLLLCIPAIIGYILFNYIPMGAAVIIPFKNYKFSKGILGSDWCGLANFKWIIQSVALDRALRNTVLYGLLFMVLSPVTNVIIALLLFEITSRRRLKTYQTIITFPNFMSMVIVGYIVYAILSPRTGLMNQIIQFFGGDPVDVYMNAKYWPFILTVVNLWKGIGMGSMMYFAALMGIDTSLYEAAEIDGASRFQKMLHISLPHLVPLICIFTIMNEVGERDDGLIRFQPASACDLKQQKRDDYVCNRTEHHEQKTVEHRVAQCTVKRDGLDDPLEVCKAAPVAAEDALGEFIILERNDDCGSHRYIVEQDITDDCRDTEQQQLTAGFCICPAFAAKARPFLFSFLCHGSHGFLRFLFLHFTNSRFYFQVVIATILAGFATTSCALLLNTNCRFPSLLVNFTLILHPLENWINRTNPVVSYYAKRTCISACAL